MRITLWPPRAVSPQVVNDMGVGGEFTLTSPPASKTGRDNAVAKHSA